MSMTNEELVLAIQAGQSERMVELWERVERFVSKQAGRWLFAFHGINTGVEYGDLMSCGYLALVEAVKAFDNERGCSFIGWLNKLLMTQFSIAVGIRTQKQMRDPLHNAASLDAPLDCDDDLCLGDAVEDKAGVAHLEQLEQREYIAQLHEALEVAMQDLSQEHKEIIYRLYYAQETLDKAAQQMGKRKQWIHEQKMKALRRIRSSPRSQQLLEFYDFNYYRGTGLSSFKHTGMSVQELYLQNLDRAERREQRAMNEKYLQAAMSNGYIFTP